MDIEAKKRVKRFLSEEDRLTRALSGEEEDVRLEAELEKLFSKLDVCDAMLVRKEKSFSSAYDGCDYAI